MKIEILEQKENPAFKRNELILKIDYEGGPTSKKADIQKEVAARMKVEEDYVEILKVLSEFGRPFGKAIVNIWEELPEHIKKKQEQKSEEKVKDDGGKEEAEK